MAVNKNFVVKNGIEVNTNLIVADTDSNKVGIGTTVPEYTLHVFEGTGIGASMVYVTGISTSLEEFNVGVGGTTFTAISNAGAGIAGSVGVGTDLPGYLLEVHAPVSTGQTALYVKGDMHVTGDINLDDITLNELKVTGISTFENSIFVGSGATVGLNTVHFADHAKAMFGDGDDLQIYHDGSNSRIVDSGTGQLILQSNQFRLLNAAGSENLIDANENGAVTLYHDASKRFETNAIGVEVSGTFQSTGITTLASAGGISTTGGDLYIGGDLFVSDNITLDTNLNILGIATIATLRVSDTATGESGTEALIVGTGLSVRGSSTGVAVTLAGAGGITTTGGDFYVGGDLYISEDVILDTNLEIIGIATIGTLQVSSTSGINTILSTVQSTSKDTGSLVLEGGLGVEKQLYVGAGASVGAGFTIGTGIGVTTILDDDAFSNASATALASQQSIKAYVDAQITAEDLDFAGDSGTGAVDLDSQTFTIAGTANEIETSASSQTLTIGLPDFVTVSNGLNVTGNGSTTTTLNVSGISTFSEDILIGTAATVGFGSTAFFGDDVKAIFGDGDDLQIYHDGSNSYIDDTGSGRLNIRGNTGVSLRNYSNSNQFINCYTDGTVELFYNNSKKFETTGAGVTVTGVTTSRGFVLAEDDAIHFRTTASEDLDSILRASAVGGQLLINSRNDTIINIDTNDDSTDAHFGIGHGAATGSSTEVFRVQENGNVGIGSENPQNALDVSGDVKIADNSPRLEFHDANADNNISATGGIEIFDKTGSRGAYMGAVEGANELTFGISPTAGAAPVEILRIDADGKVGINTNDPQGTLQINDGLNGLEFNVNSNNAVVAYNRTTSSYLPVGLQGSSVQLRIGGTGTILDANADGTITTGIATFSSTSHIKVPVGTTAQRPSGVAGDFRYNSTLGQFEGYTNAWGAIGGSGGGGGGGITTSHQEVQSTSATGISTFSTTTFRSAHMLVGITQGTSYQTGRYLIIHDNTTPTILEESALATGDMLGTFDATIAGGNLTVRVTMGNAGLATVAVKMDTINSDSSS